MNQNSGGDAIFQNVITGIFTPIYQLIATVAFLYFLYGVFRFILDFNDPEKKSLGKSHLLYGLIGLFIIFSIGGILPLFNDILVGMFSY